jgi:Outer membrane protein beta-barrel domain
MRTVFRATCLLALLAAPVDASAQTIGFRLYGVIDSDSIAASKSFKATLGTSRLTAFGGGGEVDIFRNLFVRATVTTTKKTGTRVFVDTTQSVPQVYSLHIPLTLTLTPVEVGGGLRFPIGSSKTSITPYGGASFLSVGYQETSEHADASENTNQSFKGWAGFGGVEIGLLKWLAVAAEAQYRSVPNAIGAGGVSQDFNEKNIGGFTARVTIGFRSSK